MPAHTIAILSSPRPTCPDGAVVICPMLARIVVVAPLRASSYIRSTSHVVRYATPGPATTVTSVRATAGRCTTGEKAISVPQLCLVRKRTRIISLLGAPSRVALSHPIRVPVSSANKFPVIFVFLPSHPYFYSFNYRTDFKDVYVICQTLRKT